MMMGVTGRTYALWPKGASGIYPWDAVQRNSSCAIKVFICMGSKPRHALGRYRNLLQEKMLRQTVNFISRATEDSGWERIGYVVGQILSNSFLC